MLHKEGVTKKFYDKDGQSLPKDRRLLDIEELKSFSNYRHSAEKTTFELGLSFILGIVEKYFYPSSWSANLVSVIGQLPIQIFVVYVLVTEGPTLGPDHLLSKQNCLIAGACLFWFSWHDVMDGLRARRLGCGSSLGRVIDEAGDIIPQACYQFLLAKAFGW